MGTLLNKTKVIVTGAASGIGRAIVLASLQEGAEVIACDFNKEGLENLVSVAGAGDKLHIYQVDVSCSSRVEEFFTDVREKHTEVNALVNNAGIYLGQNILNYTAQDVDKVLNVNLKGCIYFSQGFGKLMVPSQRQGVIVNISSISGQEGSSDAIYGASKAAILGLTKSCAMNFAPYVRVNAVAPTMVNTPMMNIIPQVRQLHYLNQHLIPEMLLPENVAETVIFLLSDKSRHYTGATFDINNGGYLR